MKLYLVKSHLFYGCEVWSLSSLIGRGQDKRCLEQ